MMQAWNTDPWILTHPHLVSPYTEAQWQQIQALGATVETHLQRLDVRLTMGGEPTFVSATDFESAQWRIDALGEQKQAIASQLQQRLQQRFCPAGSLLHAGIGKLYAGETEPRWALGCYWRQDGVPICRYPHVRWDNAPTTAATPETAHQFMQQLVQQLGVPSGCILPVVEPETNLLVGYTLPLLPVLRDGQLRWSSCRWTVPDNQLVLLPGRSAIGLRLPWQQLPPVETLELEEIAPLAAAPTGTGPDIVESAPNSIRVALSLEIRQGQLWVFMPPFASARSYVDAIAAIETTADRCGLSVRIEGYPPPSNQGILGFQITPDPGVIEVNIQPAQTWDQLVQIYLALQEEAHQCGLGAIKYLQDGRPVNTGGGAHITLGGSTPLDSPLLRRPDLLRSLISYWQNHPSLSYLFAGLFVGPTSQSPRLDEARHESLYELELAFQFLQPGQDVPPWLVDRLLRNLLIDVTGNTHRTALCIDKLFPVDNLPNQLGLLEFRSFAMPPHAHMNLVQLLLVRSLVAWFWAQPYTEPLIRWGTTLHDAFLLPYYLERDFQAVLADLRAAGYEFQADWFRPFWDFRFPSYGQVTCQGYHGETFQLELRHAIEPWHVLGEEMTHNGTARLVDSSLERLQVKLVHQSSGLAFPLLYTITCNGYPLPLQATDTSQVVVAAVRYRARMTSQMLHPAISPHVPLRFDVVHLQSGRSLGGCFYHVDSPNGEPYTHFPTDPDAARRRMAERFVPHAGEPQPVLQSSLAIHSDYPKTLDLRWAQPSTPETEEQGVTLSRIKP
jgi:uncharacterized protein (DUF2126 family)